MRPSPVGSSTSAVRTVSTLPARAVGLDERGDRRRAQQRGVAVDQQHRPVEVGHGGQRHGGGVPGPVLLLLDDGQRAGRDLAPGAPRPRPGRRPRRRRSRRRPAARRRRARGRAGCGRRGCAAPWASPTACGCPGRRRGRRRRRRAGAGRRRFLRAHGSPRTATVLLRWGTRTRTETARLQRPAGCRLPHPPPAARVATQVRHATAPAAEPRAGPRRGMHRHPPGASGRRSSRRPPYGAVGYGDVARCMTVADRARGRPHTAPGDSLVRSRPHPPHGPAPRRPTRTPACRRTRSARRRARSSSVMLYVFVVVPVPRAGRRRPRRLGLGAVLARRRPRRRLLLPHAARGHRRLPPATSPTARSRRSGRCGWRWPRSAAWRSRARSSSGSPTTAGTTPSPTARATRTRRGATATTPARWSRACSTPTWAGCSTAARPTPSATPPTCSRTAACVVTSRLFGVWAFLSFALPPLIGGLVTQQLGRRLVGVLLGRPRPGRAAAPRDLVDQLRLPRRRQPARSSPPAATGRPTSGRWRSSAPASRGTTCTTPTRPAPGTACCAGRSTSAPGSSGCSRSSAGPATSSGPTRSGWPPSAAAARRRRERRLTATDRRGGRRHDQQRRRGRGSG